jgi:hypothetical protein
MPANGWVRARKALNTEDAEDAEERKKQKKNLRGLKPDIGGHFGTGACF